MSETEVRWTAKPAPDKYRRLLNILFGPSHQPPDMEGGER